MTKYNISIRHSYHWREGEGGYRFTIWDDKGVSNGIEIVGYKEYATEENAIRGAEKLAKEFGIKLNKN